MAGSPILSYTGLSYVPSVRGTPPFNPSAILTFASSVAALAVPPTIGTIKHHRPMHRDIVIYNHQAASGKQPRPPRVSQPQHQQIQAKNMAKIEPGIYRIVTELLGEAITVAAGNNNTIALSKRGTPEQPGQQVWNDCAIIGVGY